MSYTFTNRQYLSQLTDQELAHWLGVHLIFCPCVDTCKQRACIANDYCIATLVEWLQKEIEGVG